MDSVVSQRSVNHMTGLYLICQKLCMEAHGRFKGCLNVCIFQEVRPAECFIFNLYEDFETK